MNKDNIIKRYVKLFNFCKDANIVVYFHKKASDAIWKNWLYIAIPVIIFAINLFFMIKANVLWGQGNSGKMTLSYLRDLSNSNSCCFFDCSFGIYTITHIDEFYA